MHIYFKDGHDLICDMEDGKPTFKLGWVQNTNERDYYCMCSWMTELPRDSYQRPWLQPSAYPEEHIFKSEHEAMQALIDSAMVAVIGGFRGRGERQ